MLYEQPHGFTQSVILHGPPGSGKTTIARLLAHKSVFVELNALSTGVAQVRDEIEAARLRRDTFDKHTVLFIDEIHRFAKNQQEALLSAVESGVVTLIAATTEQPTVTVVKALVSRCLVFELNPLSHADILELLKRALHSEWLPGKRVLSEEASDALVRFGSGDARRALNLLQVAVSRMQATETELRVEHIQQVNNEDVVDYDLDGDYHYDTISAFIKSIRGSDADAAIYYLALMLTGHEKIEFIGRRLLILAAEDIGLADPHAIVIVNAAYQAATQVGMPEARIPLAEATIYLALAPKSNSAYRAINTAMDDITKQGRLAVPEHLKNAQAGGYNYPHDFDPPIVSQQYLREPRRFFVPGNQGYEEALGARWRQLVKLLGKSKA
jgi:putative ATPase